jgi:hypothetical protein
MMTEKEKEKNYHFVYFNERLSTQDNEARPIA